MKLRLLITSILLNIHLSYADQVEVHIIDTGPGLATVTLFPTGDVFVYDTGHFRNDAKVSARFQSIIGTSDIDLMIVSHSDADHLGSTDELFNNHRVHRVIRTGFDRTTDAYENHEKVIEDAATIGLTHNVDLSKHALPHGTVNQFGEATLTVISGFHEPPSSLGLRGSEFRNGNSIVVRLVYKGQSVLFTGDAVGRVEGSDDNDPIIATERYMIDNAAIRPIDSDILIASYHGGDDGSSAEFIKAVSPRWVIFSAGHQHSHPRKVTVERYIDLGYDPKCLLRTDKGDDEGAKEWSHSRTADTSDPILDGDIMILISDTGDPIVSYQGKSPIDCTQLVFNGTPETSPFIIKKSNSGICHSPGSTWYSRNKNFTFIDSLADCLASGGREPR